MYLRKSSASDKAPKNCNYAGREAELHLGERNHLRLVTFPWNSNIGFGVPRGCLVRIDILEVFKTPHKDDPLYILALEMNVPGGELRASKAGNKDHIGGIY